MERKREENGNKGGSAEADLKQNPLKKPKIILLSELLKIFSTIHNPSTPFPIPIIDFSPPIVIPRLRFNSGTYFYDFPFSKSKDPPFGIRNAQRKQKWRKNGVNTARRGEDGGNWWIVYSKTHWKRSVAATGHTIITPKHTREIYFQA